jgi:hypothetical protein
MLNWFSRHYGRTVDTFPNLEEILAWGQFKVIKCIQDSQLSLNERFVWIHVEFAH